MAVNYTTLLGLAQPVTGTEAGLWGDVVNNEITALIEDAVSNAASINVTAGNATLTSAVGVSNQARCAIILAFGTPGVSRNIVAPSRSKAYIVINDSDASVVFKGSATTGVTIAAGDKALIAWQGTDFVRVGASAGGSNTQVQFNSSGNLAGSAGLTFSSGTGQLTATLLTGRLRSYTESVTTATVSTSTANLDLSLSNIFDITLGANVTFTFTNPPSAGISQSATIILRQDATGNRTATFVNANFSDGLAPTLSTGANEIDVLTFFTVNGGSFYFGTFAMADVS